MIKQGQLLIIGGNEDKNKDCIILKKFLEMAGGRDAKIAVITTATEYPREVGDEYRTVLMDLGAYSVDVVFIPDRYTANNQQQVLGIEACSGIFFTGGDQLRLTSILGGSLADTAIRVAFSKGTVVAGTSAGASVMSDTMIVDGGSSDTPKKANLNMAHGMGLLKTVVIDQHFAQRGRINRLLGAVAQNPNVLGVGIDEDTALQVQNTGECEVIGSQTVTIIDGKNIMHSNISELQPSESLAITNVNLHVLSKGFGYNLITRVPYVIDIK